MSIIYEPKDAHNIWCVYSHKIHYETEVKTMYIGFCKLAELFDCPDAHRNDMWQKHVMNELAVQVDVLHQYDTWQKAISVRYKLIVQEKPYCNIYGKDIASKWYIECIETGEVFESQIQACSKLGLSPPSMSNHLKGVHGYKTVGNLTFRRIQR